MSTTASAYEIAKFREDEKKNTSVSSKAPDCIESLPKETPSRQSLTDEQWNAAKDELVSKEYFKLQFPKTMKLHRDPPISGQFLGLISFIPSPNATPDKDGCFGVLKLRGNFESEQRCDTMAENIIRNHDSYAVIDYVYVGAPFPLMVNNELYRASTKEVDIRRKIDDAIKADIKQKRETEKKEMEEIQQRQKELLRDIEEEKERNFDDIEFYIQLKTKKANLAYQLENIANRRAEINDLIKKSEIEIERLEKLHPNYKDEFLDRYKNALKTSGVDPEQSPLIKFMK